MDLVLAGFITISEAYEKVVKTLQPSARSGDNYLLSLNEDERDAAFDATFDAEKGAEKLFADALQNGQLTRWGMSNGTMVRGVVLEEWKPSDLGVPGLDSHLPDFTDSNGDGSRSYIEERELNDWIAPQLAARNGSMPVSQETTDLEFDEMIRSAAKDRGGDIGQNDAERIVRDKLQGIVMRRLRKKVRESVKRVCGNQNSGPRGPRKNRAS